MSQPSRSIRRRHPSGKVNPVSVLLVVALAAAGWYGSYVVPIYYDNLDVREAFEQGLNVAIIEGVDRARVGTVRKLNTMIGTHYAIDEETGAETIEPGLGIEPEAFAIDIDTPAKLITGHLEYDRVVQLKPLQKRKSFHFVHDKKVKLQ